MRILKVYKDNFYLIIETDFGLRKCKLNFRGINEIEKKCHKFQEKGCLVEIRTSPGWSNKKWFSDIWEVNEKQNIVSEIQEISNNNDINTTKNITLNSLDKFQENTLITKSSETTQKYIQRIFGPPGTGKTTKLINEIVKTSIEQGVKKDEIAFLGFTNASCDAAISSLSDSDLNSGKIDFPYFRTLHSMATLISNSSFKIMEKKDLRQFDPMITFKEDWIKKGDGSTIRDTPEHPILSAWSLAIQTKEAFDHNVEDSEDVLCNYFKCNISEINRYKLTYVSKYIKSYLDFKKNNRLLDFDDVLINITNHEYVLDHKFPNLKILIIDEAQDLSNLQWDFVERLIKQSTKIYLSGDDDQAIMTKFGASPDKFKSFKTNVKDISLQISYRVPFYIKDYVDMGVMKHIEQLKDRVKKTWSAKIDDDKGTIFFKSSNFDERLKNKPEHKSVYEKFNVNVTSGFNKSSNIPIINWSPPDLVEHLSNNQFEEWLILCPTNSTAKQISKALNNETISIPHFLKNKPVLNAKEYQHGIDIRTIHTSKGLGSKNVAIVINSIGDIVMLGDPDPRLAYVSLTRAKSVLIPRVCKQGLFHEYLKSTAPIIYLLNYLFRFPMPSFKSTFNQNDDQFLYTSSSLNIKNEIEELIFPFFDDEDLNNLLKCWKIFGLKPNSNIEEVNKKYRVLAKKWHPDLSDNEENIEYKTLMFIKIQNAYEIIKKHLSKKNI